MAGTFEITLSESGKYRFNLLAGNGQVILTSQGYSDKKTAENGIESVRKNSADDGRFDRKVSTSNQPYFSLTATNGQIIGTSQMYKGESSRDNGIDSVKTNAPTAKIKDTTV